MKTIMKIVLILLLVLIPCGLFARQTDFSDASPVPSTRDLSKDLLVNTLLPGYWQLKQGETAEGILYMSTWPLLAASTFLLWDVLADVYVVPETYDQEVDGKRYLWYSDTLQDSAERWKYFTGIILSAASSLLYTYSTYAAGEDFSAEVSPWYPESYGEKLSLGEVLAAPWKPENVFNFDVFPVFPMLSFLSAASGDYTALGDYFDRETVPFLGSEVSPAAGLALAAGSSILLANMSTVSEEITFRGSYLRSRGIHVSSIVFGAAHLSNMLLPNTSVEDTVLQAVFATLFGYYAGSRTMENDYDFRRMIALHFWHNVTAMTLEYLLNPESAMIFSIGIRLGL